MAQQLKCLAIPGLDDPVIGREGSLVLGQAEVVLKKVLVVLGGSGFYPLLCYSDNLIRLTMRCLLDGPTVLIGEVRQGDKYLMQTT